MLEGQKIREVSIQDIFELDDYRLEAEFHISNKIEFDSVKGVDVESFSQYGTSKDLNENHIGFPVLRLNEFDSFFISEPAKCCDSIDFETYKSLKLKKDDVLICRTNGNPKLVGKSAIVPQDYEYAFASYLFRVRPDINIINSATLVTFLNSRYGRMEIEKYSMVGNQANFSPAKFRQISVPIFSKHFNIEIEKLVYKSFYLSEESKKHYWDAIEIVDSELGLKDWQPNNASVNIKHLKESFLASDRLDAEYYQTKYDELFCKLSKYECDTIKDIANMSKSVEPGSKAYQESGIPFVRVSNVSKFGISEPNIFLSPKDFDLKELQPKKNTILLSKDGSVGIAYKVENDMDCITSGALLHLSVFNQDYTPDYLTLVLNSIVVRMQAERDSNGAVIQHWKPSEIEQVIIPKLPKSIQETISAKIQESFALKAESKRLLEEAKLMVEREIEKGGE